eukprot:scaffold571_cov34-Cyclotella_meneghiniana.AAC.4
MAVVLILTATVEDAPQILSAEISSILDRHVETEVIARLADVLSYNVHTKTGNYQIGVFVVLIRTATQTGAITNYVKISLTETRSAIQISHANLAVAKRSAGVILGLSHGNVDVHGYAIGKYAIAIV